MAAVQIQREEEIESGWRFTVEVAGSAEAPARLTFTLSWADYDHWSRGMERPSEVARQVLEFLLTRRLPHDLPERFDASTVRRWLPEIEQVFGRTC